MQRMIRECAFGLAIVAGASLAGDRTGLPWLGSLGLLIGTAVIAASIWRSADPDPADSRVDVTADEARLAADRMPWVQATINDLLGRANGPQLRPVIFANRGAYYSPIANRISVSKALCARLADQDLRLILAHEVAHATRRARTWAATFREAARLREELRADAMALSLVDGDTAAWASAMDASEQAEGAFGVVRELQARRLALGLADAGSEPQ